MKKTKLMLIAAALMLMLSLVSCASVDYQSMDEEFVMEVPGKTKDELFVAANIWAAEYFNDSRAVIAYSDKDAGVIAGKYHHQISDENFLFPSYSTGYDSDFLIEVKDGAMRLNLSSRVDEYDMEEMKTAWTLFASSLKVEAEDYALVW